MNTLNTVAKQAIGLIDLTTLNDNDDIVIALCQDAKTAFANAG